MPSRVDDGLVVSPPLSTTISNSAVSLPSSTHDDKQTAPLQHRRSYAVQPPAFSPVYTHLSPISLNSTSSSSSSSALLTACKSHVIYFSDFEKKPIPLSQSDENEEEEEEDLITALSATHCASLAIVAHRSGFVRLYKLPPNGKPIAVFRPFGDKNVVSHIAVHPASRYAAFAATDGSIRVHDLQNTSLTHVLSTANTAIITTIAFPPVTNTTLLCVGCGDGSVQIFDLSSSKQKSSSSQARLTPKRVFRPHVARVTALTFPNQDHIVVSTALDSVLAVSSLSLEKNSQHRKDNSSLIALSGPSKSATCLSDGRVVIATQGSATLSVWSVNNGGIRDDKVSIKIPLVSDTITATSKMKNKANDQDDDDDDDDDDDEGDISITHIVPTANGICVALSDCTLLRVLTGNINNKNSSSLKSVIPQVICAHLEEIYDVRVVRANKDFIDVAVASNSPIVWIMRRTTANTSRWSCIAGLRGHSANVLSISSNASGFLVSASRDRSVRLWHQSSPDKSSWSCLAVAHGHTDAVAAVSIDANATFFVSAGADRTLKLWRTDEMLREREKKKKRNKKKLINENVDKMETDGNQEDQEENNCDIVDVCSSQDRNDDDTEIDIETLSAHWTILSHEKDVNAVAISPDSKIIATGSQDRTLKLWNSINGKLIHTCRGHKRGIWSIAFSQVDRVIASASADTTIRIFSVQSGACLRTLQGHVSGVLRLTFLSRGTQLASSAADGTLKLWTTRTGECDTSLVNDESRGNDGRCWALDVTHDGEMLISGNANGFITCWTDETEMVAEREAKKRTEEAQILHVVDAATRAKKWSVALAAAVKLGMHQKLHNICADVIASSNNDDNMSEEEEQPLGRVVREVFEHASDQGKNEEKGWNVIAKLVLCCRDWHAAGGAKKAAVGAALLQAVLTSWTSTELTLGLTKALPDSRAVVEALDAHTKRHLDRVNALLGRAPILEQVLVTMRGGVGIDEDQMDLEDDDGDLKDDDVSLSTNTKKRRDVEMNKRTEIVRRKRKSREEVDCEY